MSAPGPLPADPAGPASRARTVIEALPWLESFRDRVVVIKFGGNAMVDEELKAAFAQDVVSLRYAGLRPVVVHGGGPQISSLLGRLDLEVRFAAGLRVTTPEIMDVVRMVLAGRVQREIVGLINAHGPFAVGLTGEDAHTMTAVRRPAWVDGEPVDIGLVGEVVRVDPDTLRALLDGGRIPVVSPVARGEDGQIYNINADLAAAALASALNAEKLVMLTDVEGLYADWPHSTEVIERLTVSELEKLLPGLASGMVPKMEGCLRAVRDGGVRMAHVLDGRVPHSLLLEVFTDDRTGTTVVPDARDQGRPSTGSPASEDGR
ncbi:acetylglutamate kinase [Streptomyces inusitatus]|uniref:Acetylglutamate kinase n=1 Tax=Streptomyces inusitatus TaxID=68221 RepID=A0A918QPE7_9ACTN|nr:acetylglutamate kinase [Streptomyces inusitatus]GGZ61382.1 acetylglutamate kinase [Streptomyces inusitatus]